MRLLFMLLSFSFFSGCLDKNQVLDSHSCDNLSLAAFRGNPKAAFKFKEGCKGIKVTYLKELCQEALNEFVLGRPLIYLEEKYGNKIGGCFTQNDIKKFANEIDKKKLMNMNKE